MKNTLIIYVLSFFFFNQANAEFKIKAPQKCTDCEFGFRELSTEFLGGGWNGYYGTAITDIHTAKNIKYNPDIHTDEYLGDVDFGNGKIGRDGYALFYNYVVNSDKVHLTKLSGRTKVFRSGNNYYIKYCGNLIQIFKYSKYQKYGEEIEEEEEEVVEKKEKKKEYDDEFYVGPGQVLTENTYVGGSYQIIPTYRLVQHDYPNAYSHGYYGHNYNRPVYVAPGYRYPNKGNGGYYGHRKF